MTISTSFKYLTAKIIKEKDKRMIYNDPKLRNYPCLENNLLSFMTKKEKAIMLDVM